MSAMRYRHTPRAHDRAIAGLLCGLLALLLFSLISGPSSTGAVAIGVPDAIGFAILLVFGSSRGSA
jgi:hypothetical protein